MRWAYLSGSGIVNREFYPTVYPGGTSIFCPTQRPMCPWAMDMEVAEWNALVERRLPVLVQERHERSGYGGELYKLVTTPAATYMVM